MAAWGEPADAARVPRGRERKFRLRVVGPENGMVHACAVTDRPAAQAGGFGCRAALANRLRRLAEPIGGYFGMTRATSEEAARLRPPRLCLWGVAGAGAEFLDSSFRFALVFEVAGSCAPGPRKLIDVCKLHLNQSYY
jgi:hypothetical protein